jgi:hypothetical protein
MNVWREVKKCTIRRNPWKRLTKAMKTDNTKETQMITTRQQAIDTGLSFPDTYQDA